jgi:predicted Zn-dependent protease
MRFYLHVELLGVRLMRLDRYALLSVLLMNVGLAAFGASVKEDASSGRAGNWHKSVQGSPDLKLCAKRAQDEPQNAEAQNDYGWSLRQNGDLPNAEKYLRLAESLNPSLGYVHSNLSVVLLDQKKNEEALAEGKKAVDADGKQPIYRVVYGNALFASDSVKSAIEEYNSAIKLRPDYENGYYNLGRALKKDGQVTEAKAALSEALKLDPNDERVLELLDQLMK